MDGRRRLSTEQQPAYNFDEYNWRERASERASERERERERERDMHLGHVITLEISSRIRQMRVSRFMFLESCSMYFGEKEKEKIFVSSFSFATIKGINSLQVSP